MQSQKWPEVEHIVIDGASSDGTVQLIQSCLRSGSIFVSESDNGIYDALNKGFSLSTGQVIGVLHSDDYFTDQDVLAQIAFIFSDPSVDAVYGDLDYVSKSNELNVVRRWRSGKYERWKLIFGWMPPHPALFLRRNIIERLGGYDTNFRISGDYDSILRYFWKGGIRVRYIPRVLVKMRTGGESNRSLERILLKMREDYYALHRNGVGGFFTLFLKNIRKISQFFVRI